MRKIPHDMQAALVVSNGFIGLGGNHGDAAISIAEAGFEPLLEQPYCEGFHSEEYGFLTRREAEAMFGHDESGDMAQTRQRQQAGTKGRRRSPCGFDDLPELPHLRWLTQDAQEDRRAGVNLMPGFDIINMRQRMTRKRPGGENLRLDLDGYSGRSLDLEKHWGLRP